VEEFLSDVMLSEGFRGENDRGKPRMSDENLVLTTIHQAKGLEWRAVFVIGLAEGYFPHRKVYHAPAELQEERRLFYVACTRAKDILVLTYPIFVSSYMTGESICRSSTFLSEVDSSCFQQWELESLLDDEASSFVEEEQ